MDKSFSTSGCFFHCEYFIKITTIIPSFPYGIVFCKLLTDVLSTTVILYPFSKKLQFLSKKANLMVFRYLKNLSYNPRGFTIFEFFVSLILGPAKYILT